MAMPGDVDLPNYPLACLEAECLHVSHKALMELVLEDRLPCARCTISIEVARQYPHARLQEILVGLGRSGALIPKRKKLD